MPRKSTRAVTAIGIDMVKNTLHMVGLDSLGAIVLRERVSRGRITSRLANRPPCLIGIEAGMATHYVARELATLHRVRSRLVSERTAVQSDSIVRQGQRFLRHLLSDILAKRTDVLSPRMVR